MHSIGERKKKERERKVCMRANLWMHKMVWIVTHIKQMRNSHTNAHAHTQWNGIEVNLLHWSSEHAMRILGIESKLCSSFTVEIANSL